MSAHSAIRSSSRRSRRRAALGRALGRALACLLTAAGVLPARADAQTVTPRCSVFAAAGCAALRFDVVAAPGAPLALRSFEAALAGGYTFATLPGGGAATFAGEDAFSFGAPFTGTAQVRGGRALFVDFLASPGFTFELGPDGAGYLEFALAGAGDDLVVRFEARDLDGAAAAGGAGSVVTRPPAVVPEPSTLALAAGGAVGLAAAGTRRRAARA